MDSSYTLTEAKPLSARLRAMVGRAIDAIGEGLLTPADVIAGPTLTPRDRAVVDLLTHLAEDRDALLRARLLQDLARERAR